MKFLSALALAAGLIGVLPPAAQAAEKAVATANVNLRAGPSTRYPVVLTVPVGAPMLVHGCLATMSWCDVGFAGARGWVAASYVLITGPARPVPVTAAVSVGVAIPVVTYSYAYWARYYPGYAWYGAWPGPYVAPRAYGAPPRAYVAPRGYVAPRWRGPASVNASGSCAGGTCSRSVTRTGPYGNSVNRTGSATCGGGTCSGTRTTTGPYGRSFTRSGSISR